MAISGLTAGLQLHQPVHGGGVVPGQLGQPFCGPAGGHDCAAKVSVACDRAGREVIRAARC